MPHQVGTHEDQIKEKIIIVRARQDDEAELLHVAHQPPDQGHDQNQDQEVEQVTTMIVVVAEVVAEVVVLHVKKTCTIHGSKSLSLKQTDTNQTGRHPHLSEPHYIGIMHASALHADQWPEKPQEDSIQIGSNARYVKHIIQTGSLT